MKTPHVVPSSIAFIAAAVCVIVLSLSPLPCYATQQAIRRFVWGLVGRWHRHVVFWIERKDPMPRNLRSASSG